jgi:hypothetical protein
MSSCTAGVRIPQVLKIWDHERLIAVWALTACYWDSFFFFKLKECHGLIWGTARYVPG